MRFPLRRQILLLTVPPLAALGVASLWIVHEHVSTQVHASLREDLRRAAAVFESVLEQRAHTLSVLGAAIAEDPKFFSVLAIPASHDDPQLRATVEGVAGDFAGIAQSDRFEVLDDAGHTLATVGRDASPAPLPPELVRRALLGERVVAVIGRGAEPYQVSLTPVRAGNRRVGVLVLGARLGDALARQMRDLTRSEVTFVSGGAVRATTVEDPADLSALLDGLRGDAGWPASRSAPPLIAKAPGRGHAWLALARAIPGAVADEPHHYVMQRALDRETAFLTRLQGTLVQFGVAAVIAVLLAAIAISTRITAPLQRLMRGAEEMERGNYEWPLDIRRGDEIGVLAGRFDDMRRRQRATVQNLQELARLRSEFIAVASHELRTPLTVLRGYQEVLDHGALGTLEPRQANAVRAMGHSIDALSRIAEDATRLAQLDADRLELSIAEHGIAAVVTRAVDAARAAAPGRRLEITGRVDPAAGSMRADGTRIAAALDHLLRNGIRFTPDGGTVELSARVEHGDVVFEVRDSGVGIAPEKQATLFQAAGGVRESRHHHSSHTLEFNSAGLGLGLAIASGIVRAHGGTLAVSSQLGRGSTFVVRLPRAAVVPMEIAA